MKFIRKKDIDKPWKIFLWIMILDRIFKFPLRFFKSYFTEETMLIFSLVTIFTFLAAVVITGYAYTKIIGKILDKKFRLRAGLYVSGFTLVMGLIISLITKGFFISIFDAVFNSVVNFFIVYYLIILGCKLGKK